jgi:formylglycine-generating enzyme required for sulfatase activity
LCEEEKRSGIVCTFGNVFPELALSWLLKSKMNSRLPDSGGEKKLRPEKPTYLNRDGFVGPCCIAAFAVLALTVVGCGALQRRGSGTAFRDCDECPIMVVILAGRFTMGDSVYGNPEHPVTIGSPFAVAKDMITRDEYKYFLAENGVSLDISLHETSPRENGNNPVVNVSWEDAHAYVKWLSVKAHHQYRVLSESEYEYAERAGTTTSYWWGFSSQFVCWYANFHECSSGTTAVGSYRPNAFGLDDMAGNAFEWVDDCWHPSYDGAPSDGSPWTTAGCSSRVMRGGAWFMIDVTLLRSSYRNLSNSSNRSDVIGFRVARDLRFDWLRYLTAWHRDP